MVQNNHVGTKIITGPRDRRPVLAKTTTFHAYALIISPFLLWIYYEYHDLFVYYLMILNDLRVGFWVPSFYHFIWAFPKLAFKGNDSLAQFESN